MTAEVVMGFVRHLLTFGGGFLVSKGLLDAENLVTAVAAIATLVGVGWSIFNKKTQAAAVTTALKTPAP